MPNTLEKRPLIFLRKYYDRDYTVILYMRKYELESLVFFFLISCNSCPYLNVGLSEDKVCLLAS